MPQNSTIQQINSIIDCYVKEHRHSIDTLTNQLKVICNSNRAVGRVWREIHITEGKIRALQQLQSDIEKL